MKPVCNIYKNTKMWTNSEGKLHREDGPAIVWGKINDYYFRGKQIDVKTDEEFQRFIKLKAFW